MTPRTPRTLFATAAVAALLLAGCGTDSGDAASDDPTGGDATGFPVAVGDLTLQERPDRIVSLAPAVTEMLFAVGAGEQVVAVDEFSNYPPEAPTTELSGFDVNPEAVADYEPDLVVISSNADTVSPQLEKLGIPVHLAPDDPRTVEDVYDQITDLGALTGNADQASELVDQMASDLDRLAAEAPERDEPLSYYIEIDDTYWTYTSQSLVGSLFEPIGLENIASEPGSVSIQLSAEAIVDANPDVIFLTNTAYGVDAESVADRAGWSAIEAVRNDHIFELDTDIASRWGPRTVDLLAAAVDAVSQVP